MKKFLKLFAIVLAIFMVMAIFAACHKKTNDPDTPDKPVDNTPVDDNPTPDNPTPDTPVHEHAWDEGTVTKEATCTEAGEKVYKCSGCEETKVEVIAALGHTWDEGKVTKEATFAAEGETTFTCTVCGETKVEPIAKIEVDTTPEEKGKIVDVGDARYRANGDGTYTYLEYRGDKLEVVIPAVANNRRVTGIEEGAFDPSAEIYSITIQNGIEVIEADAFANCTALTEIVIPDSVKEIGDNAFKGCAALQQVKLGAGVESFSANVFAGCTQIAILDLGGLEELEAGTFADAEKSLVKVTIGAKMGDLNGCFETATDYKLVVIENKSTNPEFDAGVKVTALLDKIEDTEGIAVVVEKDYVFYLNGKGGVALISYIGLDGNKLDPEDDEEEKVQAAKKIVLPESYGKDEDKYTIYKYAFYGRDDIATVIIDKGATAVGESAFDASKLTKVTIPATVTSIAANAFEDCTKLAEVIFEGKDTTVDSTAFTNCVALKTATMPANADNTIRDAAAWENLTLTGETVPAFKFEAKTALKKVTFAETIKTIGDGAFVGCTSFATLTFDGTPALTTIGEKAFGNTAITALNLPKSVTDIDIGITTGCNDLTTITVVDGNTVYSAAGNCLIEIDTKTVIAGCKVSVIPTDGSVTKIGENAFEGLDITSITIPTSVTSIGANAFYGCTLITGTTNVINYLGTKSAWALISKDGDWDYGMDSHYVVHCTDGNICKTHVDANSDKECDVCGADLTP